MTKSNSEERSSARIRRPIGAQYMSQGNFGWRVGRITDFGWEGAKLISAEPLEPATPLQIRFVMSGAEGPAILQAKVVWSRFLPTPGHSAKKFENGITFTSPKPLVQETVQAAFSYVLKNEGPSQSAERRRSRRVPKAWETAYHEVDHPTIGWRTGTVINLSVHGMQFQSPELLKSGEIVEMRMPAHDGEEPVVMKGRVVWSQVVPDQAARYGVEFTEPKAGHEKRFEAFVQWLSGA